MARARAAVQVAAAEMWRAMRLWDIHKMPARSIRSSAYKADMAEMAEMDSPVDTVGKAETVGKEHRPT